ncbi:MAG: hypothetical protein ABI574_15140 [Burkholderiales bacterium]
MNLLTRVRAAVQRQRTLSVRIDRIQEALGRIESRLGHASRPCNPRDNEFRVYSQWGEDGIIDYLVSCIDIPDKAFVEFGVENYTEANTLFLLKHRHWRGLIIDGSPDHIGSVKASDVYWRYALHADASFITRDNINEIILRNGFEGDIGLLSVDIDGNDYWVWEAITCVRPRIVVSEYNSLFGFAACISTPYAPDFYRTRAHPSNMYYGASIAALDYLARSRGYTLVAGNSAGNNVFFVRNDCLGGGLVAQSPAQAYVAASFREAKSFEGGVDGLTFVDRQRMIEHLPVVDVTTGQQQRLRELL